ncbi:unnamed protein product [Urochloa humidicola]
MGKEGDKTCGGTAPGASMVAATNTPNGHPSTGKARPTVALKPTGLVDGTKAWVAEAFYGQPTMKHPQVATPVKETIATQIEEVSSMHTMNPTQMPIGSVTPTRKSKRNASTADQDSIKKAA